MVEVGVEVLSFGDIDSSRVLVLVSGQNVVDVVDLTRPHPNLGEVCGPHSPIGVLGLLLRDVDGVDTVLDLSISLGPLLVVVLLEVVVGRTDGEHGDHVGEFELVVGLVEQYVVLLVHDSVAIGAVLGEDLEASTDGPSVVVAPESELGPLHVSVVGSHLGHLLLVSLDTPPGTDVVPVEPGLPDLDVLHEIEPHGRCCDPVECWHPYRCLSLLSPIQAALINLQD